MDRINHIATQVITEEKSLQDQLYNLGLHEGAECKPDIFVMRVIGGWIYQVNFDDRASNAVFVPEPPLLPVSATLEEITRDIKYTHQIVRGSDGYWLHIKTDQGKHACFHLAYPARIDSHEGQVLSYITEDASTERSNDE